MGIENPVHLAFIAIVALLVLGPKRLPELARALGRGIREFREAVNQPGEQPLQPPAAQEPAAHGVLAQEPVVQGAVVQEPAAEEPVVQGTVVQEPAAREPVVQGTVVQEPAAREPVVQGTVVQEPAAREPVGQVAAAQEPVIEDAVVVGETVDPTQALRSGDAPDSRPL